MTSAMDHAVDAVVVGAGHNGLVAANLLADAGWSVAVLEAAPEPGGAVRTDELHPGFRTDRCSSFFPMTATSPVMTSLGLERHGLSWAHAPTVLAHLRSEGPAVVLHRDPAATAAGLDRASPGDGAAWLALQDDWSRWGIEALRALLAPFPPLRAGARAVWAARGEPWDAARTATLSARALARERFRGEDPALLLAGNALHADVPLDAAPSGFLGWSLVGMAQSVGFPVPVGGAGALTGALVRRLEAAGGTVRTGTRVRRIVVERGRARGVDTDGGTVRARRAVLAACDAQVLYGQLLAPEQLPASFRARFERFQRGDGIVKIDYALSSPAPWLDEAAHGAGTLHLADSLAELTLTGAQLANGHLPDRPFVLVGQMTTADPTRSPAGTEALWAYAHVPQRVTGDAAGELDAPGALRGGPLRGGVLHGDALTRFAERMEDRIEALAPGFRDRIVARRVVGPAEFEASNPSLVGGDLGGGTSQIHQQLVFRPVPGFGTATTPVRGLFLASSSAHPGGAVHGAPGANAARAAMRRRTRLPTRPS